MTLLRRLLPPILIGLLALVAFHWRVRHEMADFSVYRQAAERVIHAEPLYRESDGHYQFKYLPVFAMATAPFALVDVETAKVVWFAVLIGVLVLLVRWSAWFVPERRRAISLLAGLTLLFMAKFYAHELVLGQVNLVFGLLIVAAVGALQSEIPIVAGVLVGAAVCVKPYGLLFLPWLFFTADRRATIACACAIVAALIAPAAIYGFGGNFALLADWWRTVDATTAPNLLGNDNVSFAAMWAKWIGVGTAARVLAAATAVAAVALVADAGRRRKTEHEPAYLEAAALLLLIPLLSPQGWDYVLLLATPAVALLIDRLPEMPRGWQVQIYAALGVMGFVSFDLLGRERYGRFMGFSAITICAIAVLYALTELRRRDLA
jgi:hypothetical protein